MCKRFNVTGICIKEKHYMVDISSKIEKIMQLVNDQLLDYMCSKRADNGYLLTFDFRKEKNKKRKTEWVQINDKRIFDVIE